MSIRHFCDQCGKEIVPAALTPSNRVITVRGKLKTEVHVAVSGVWNGGHACAGCVIDAVANGARVSPSNGEPT